jgi:hypothetical protein
MIIDVCIRFASFKTESDPFFFLLTFYLFGFSALLVFAELGYKKVLVYVEFLSGRAGKGLYIMFVGLLIFDATRPSDMGIAILLVLIGIFNVLIGCMRDAKYSEYEEYMEEDEDEIEGED